MGRIEVLDHGYVSLIDSWGSDQAIIESARMSTQKGFLGWGPLCVECGSAIRGGSGECGSELPGGGLCKSMTYKLGDEKLLRFMWEHQHSTPFEFAGATFEVQAPLIVFREWHRHRTQSYSEASARYAPLPDVNYVPTVERILTFSEKNKQAGAIAKSEQINVRTARLSQQAIERVYAAAEREYQAMLEAGVPKELARLVLPVGRYSRMRASTDLRNWLGFLTLRMAPNAQWEIRQYADAVHALLVGKFPRTLALFGERR